MTCELKKWTIYSDWIMPICLWKLIAWHGKVSNKETFPLCKITSPYVKLNLDILNLSEEFFYTVHFTVRVYYTFALKHNIEEMH
jgi:hypothetical protein